MKCPCIIIVVILSWINLHGQTCDCEKEFIFVKNYIEVNYAGFSDKVSDSNRSSYVAFSEELMKKAKIAQNSNYCYFTIQNYLNYFKDGHVQLVSKATKNTNDTVENILLTSQVITALKNKPLTDIEGIYITPSKKYEIALFKNPNSFRDYTGVILNTSVKSWKVGEVKVELKHIAGNKYQGMFYYQDHHPEINNYVIKEGKFSPEDFIKINAPSELPKDTEPFSKLENSNKAVFYKDVNDSTGYLRIKSFDDHFSKKILSEVKSNEKKIKSKPYLILDLRYNGGGSDFSYTPLVPFIYTNPIGTVGADVFSTPDNIKAWQRVIDENPSLPEEVKKNIADIITKMKENLGKLVNIGGDGKDTLKTFYTYPRKVAILIDEGCASSTEQFLLAAKQSKKVVLMGQHTAGVLDYSNMRTVSLNCMPYVLGYATSRSRRIPENAIDNTGIAPDIIMDFNKTWLESVLNGLK